MSCCVVFWKLLVLQKVFFQSYHCPYIVVYDVGLIQLWCYTVNPCAEASVLKESIICYCRCKQALTVLSANYQKHFPKLSITVFWIYQTEYTSHKCLLPQFQFQVARRTHTFRVMAILFNPFDGLVSLFSIKLVRSVLNTVNYAFIEHQNPLANKD